MSYENTSCPCGGKKPTDTMLCADCLAEFKDRRELTTLEDGNLPVEVRRHAAVILVTLSRNRKRDNKQTLFRITPAMVVGGNIKKP